jgi:hypothetical protein
MKKYGKYGKYGNSKTPIEKPPFRNSSWNYRIYRIYRILKPIEVNPSNHRTLLKVQPE